MPTRDTPWPEGTPCWVDLMSPDAERARAFYGELFGWQFQVGDESTGFYAMASLDDQQVAGVGALMAEGQPTVWTTYLAASDIEKTAQAILEAGGTVIQPPMDVFDFGRMAIAQDPTGGVFGLWQAGTHLGSTLVNETGTVVWNELLTRDYDAARAFYTDVFGYTYTELGDDGFQYSTIEVDGNTVGGLGGLPAEVPAAVPPHWLTYFAVDDADAAVEKAVALGGSVQRPAQDMPYGRHAGIADPSGAGFAVLKPIPGPAN